MNKNYFLYLFKKRKIAIFFFLAVYVGMAFAPFMFTNLQDGSVLRDCFLSSVAISSAMSTILCFGLPILLFHFVHQKRTVDIYFSLPVKRSEQLITTLLFIFAIAFGYFIIGVSLAYFLSMPAKINFTIYLYILAFGALMLLVFILVNSLCFLVANNLFDGIVMIAAYNFMAVAILVFMQTFNYNLIAGSVGMMIGEGLIAYFSPLNMSMVTMLAIVRKIYNSIHYASVNGSYILMLIVYGVVAAYGLYRHFVLRKAERAEQVSSGFFAYPFIIHFYAIICLFILSMSTSDSLGSAFMLYLLLLVIYIVATFVYKRKISIDWKYLLFYAIALVLSIALVRVGYATRGFGIADNYNIQQGELLRYYYQSFYDVDADNGFQVMIEANIPTKEIAKHQEVVDYFESMREESIEAFYQKKDIGISEGYLSIHNLDNIAQGRLIDERQYTIFNKITKEDIRMLNEHNCVNFTLYNYEGVEVKVEDFLKGKGE